MTHQGSTKRRRQVVAIGKFEGVHRGHQHILHKLVEVAAEREADAVVLTFTNNPLSYLHPEICPEPVMSPSQRREALMEFGLEGVLMIPFDARIAQLSSEKFVHEYLVTQMGASHVIVGDDFKFAAQASGTPEVLAQLGKKYGFTVEVIDEVADPVFGRISSSRVREALAEGDVEQAAQLLGKPHRMRGVVVHGDARGRDLGFPTANLGPHKNATHVEGFVPADGVYGGYATVKGETRVAAISVGNNPTFTPNEVKRVEAYLLDTDENLYGEDIELSFIARIRRTLTFEGIEQLIEAMHHDIERVRKLVPPIL